METEITDFKAKEVSGLFIIKSPFGYFFINHAGVQVQDPETGEITPSEKNEFWNTILAEKQLSPFLRSRVIQIIKRFLAEYLEPNQARKKLTYLLPV